jgi:uncharacterized protein YjbI with pentapeptide repeats
MDDAVFDGCNFREARFKGHLFEGNGGRRTRFISCTFDSAQFKCVEFRACRFVNCTFQDSEFLNADMKTSRFEGRFQGKNRTS